MTTTYDIEEPFADLSAVAGWWGLRPTDKGDGRGYTGMALTVKQKGNPMAAAVEFQGDDLQSLVRRAVAWCGEQAVIEQPTSNSTKPKRVIKRQ